MPGYLMDKEWGIRGVGGGSALPFGKGKGILPSLEGKGRLRLFPPYAEQVKFPFEVFGTLAFAKICHAC